jgi:hypothetical protein
VRKGRTCGTILGDLEQRRVLGLLPDRTAAMLADRLRCRPGVEVITRGRSTEHARGIVLGAPGATQVADRRHLLANLRQMLERWLAGARARLRRLPPRPGSAPTDARSRTGPFSRTRAEAAARAGRRERRIALHEEVRRRQAAGEGLLAISRAMGLGVGTGRKHAHAQGFPGHEARPLRPSILDPYLARLGARLAEGGENGLVLWRELRAAGFTGTAKQVRTAGSRSTGRHRPGIPRTRGGTGRPAPVGPGRPPALPSPTRLAWLLVQPPAGLLASDAAVATRVEQDREAASVAVPARRFTLLVRGCGAGAKVAPDAALAEVEAWLADARTSGGRAVGTLADARTSGGRAVGTFAAGLEQDRAAVRSALTAPWSNGQAEGQVTRLKLLTRPMHGRAGFDLLRRRILLAA